jgi:hypothetical protein
MDKLPPFYGVYPVVPTPLKEDESLDLAGMEHLVDYYVREGCHGLLVLGSGGESPYFTIDEKVDVLKTVVRKVNKRIPVIAGCTFMSLVELTSFFKKMESVAVDGFLTALPSYCPLQFDDVYSFYKEIVQRTDKKVLYYHYPQITGHFFNTDQMQKLYDIEGIVGAKERHGRPGGVFAGLQRPDSGHHRFEIERIGQQPEPGNHLSVPDQEYLSLNGYCSFNAGCHGRLLQLHVCDGCPEQHLHVYRGGTIHRRL